MLDNIRFEHKLNRRDEFRKRRLFSREYRRLFGSPPGRDGEAIRRAFAPHVCQSASNLGSDSLLMKFRRSTGV
ncbi:hypothetical protein, partial [Pseudochelatococcus lubricantis]|uniref:hypothetical protein n=1 Tax=Pseudochelatococcus lubricantis TaxID=1538102 RepID=UPI00366F370F